MIQDIILDAYHTWTGTEFKEIVTSPHAHFEQSLEDNDTNFVIGSQRRFYPRLGSNYGAISGIDLDVHFPNTLDQDDEDAYRGARELVFGDFNYPVVHEEYRDPHQVQVSVERLAARVSGMDSL